MRNIYSCISQNSLGYEHISVMDRGLTVADWDLLEFVENHIQGKLPWSEVFKLHDYSI